MFHFHTHRPELLKLRRAKAELNHGPSAYYYTSLTAKPNLVTCRVSVHNIYFMIYPGHAGFKYTVLFQNARTFHRHSRLFSPKFQDKIQQINALVTKCYPYMYILHFIFKFKVQMQEYCHFWMMYTTSGS